VSFFLLDGLKSFRFCDASNVLPTDDASQSNKSAVSAGVSPADFARMAAQNPPAKHRPIEAAVVTIENRTNWCATEVSNVECLRLYENLRRAQKRNGPPPANLAK
jgi:hypothetical protein